MADKLWRRQDAHTDALHPNAGSPGKLPTTARLTPRAQQIIFRVESPEAMRELGAGLRDGNGVTAGAEAAVDRASSGAGAALPDALRGRFERSLGADLSSVRVHTDAASADAARAVGARAFATGQDIHFAAGQYAPMDPFGVHLLAHEVAHTVQQAGGAQRVQHKLEVSTPGDAAEVEADRAADAMVAGAPAAIAGRLGGVRRTLAEDMDKEAAAEQKAVVSSAPPAVAGMSSLETVAQARDCIKKVVAANGNLYQRRATQSAAVEDTRKFSEERVKAEKDVKATDGFLAENEGVIATLQNIVDLGEGNSQTDAKGNRPGHDMRIGVFSQLAQAALSDFARLQGVVNAFLNAHPMEDQAGTAGGVALGTAVATGGKGGGDAALDKVKGQVQGAQQGDAVLNNLIQEFKGQLEAFEGGHHDQHINEQMVACASAVSKARNIKVDIDLGTARPDTPEQAAAKAEADKVNADLAAAKGALDTAADIAKLAVSVMGMPEIGALGAGSALQPQIDKVTNHPIVKTTQQVAGTASKIGAGAAKVTGVDVEKKVSGDISTAVAKMMTDYDTRITAATGHASQANANAKRDIVKLNHDMISVARGDITAEFQKLAKLCAEIEEKKAALRKKSRDIADYQKQHKKPGQPDLGAMTTAISECSAFVQQADAAILQGEEEQTIAKEMADERHKVAGDYKPTGAVEDFTGIKELGAATKADAYVDCEATPPHLLSRHPLTFRIRQDTANKSVEGAGVAVAEQLRGLKESRETAVGFEAALKRAMGF